MGCDPRRGRRTQQAALGKDGTNDGRDAEQSTEHRAQRERGRTQGTERHHHARRGILVAACSPPVFPPLFRPSLCVCVCPGGWCVRRALVACPLSGARQKTEHGHGTAHKKSDGGGLGCIWSHARGPPPASACFCLQRGKEGAALAWSGVGAKIEWGRGRDACGEQSTIVSMRACDAQRWPPR